MATRGGRPYTAAVRPGSCARLPMSADSLAAAIDMHLLHQPFHPFTLVLNNGTRLEVDHYRGLMYRNGLGVHGGPMGVPTLFEADAVSEVVGDLSAGGDDEPAARPAAV